MTGIVLPPVKFDAPQKITLGDRELSAQACKLDMSAGVMKDPEFSQGVRDVAVTADGKIYVLDHLGKLRRFQNQAQAGDGCELALDKAFGKDGVVAVLPNDTDNDRFDTLSLDDKGLLYVSGSGAPGKSVAPDGKVGTGCADMGRLSLLPGSSLALLDRKLLAAGVDGKCEGKEIKFAGWKDTPEAAQVFGKDIAVWGQQNGKYRVGIFATDGKQKAILGADDGEEKMCNVGAVRRCGLGVCALDRNCRALKAWATDGKFLGSVEIGKWLGVSYPWPLDFAMGKDDGYMALTHSAEDTNDKDQYGIVFRIKGLNGDPGDMKVVVAPVATVKTTTSSAPTVSVTTTTTNTPSTTSTPTRTTTRPPITTNRPPIIIKHPPK